nr:copia protein [Tanacetum cinerariifolium]
LTVFVGTSVVLTLASLIPLFKGVRAESKSDGLMTSDAELWNGRFAMLGLVGLAFTEFVQDESIDSAFARFNTIITGLKSLDEGYSSKNYVRKFIRALHPKWRAKVTAIEESKDLTLLSLDELIENLKVHEMIIKKDFEIVKAKVERKSIALKAKKESSDEECLTFGSKDEEYAMATFQRGRDDKNGKSDRKCFRCGDPNYLIGECPKPSKDKNQRAFVGGSWSDSGEEDDEKVKDETCLVAHASSKDGKVIGKGIRKKGLFVMILENKPKDQICITTIDENSTLWHGRLRHANMRLIQSLASKELVRNLPKIKFDQHFCDACKIGKQAHASHKAKNVVLTTRCLELLHLDLFGPSAVRSYGGNRYTLVIVDDYSSKAYIVLNKHTKKVEESLNVTFDETPPPSKTSLLVDDDLDEEEAIKVIEKKNLKNDIVDETLEINEIVNIKESRNHPLENVIGNLNQRTLRSQAQNKSNLFCFISTLEPKNVNEALGDESWIVAIQKEINQFVANDVWELVPQPKKMIIIETKWVFRNKLDENGIVSRNKARPDIMFSVCLCARFLEAPKISHLEAVKFIFRYIKGTTHLGLWYPKETGIETVVYADSDHGGDYVDRKSTNGICTFVGCCLTSWFSKKQTALAISTTEAKYVSAEKACQQALWLKQALIDYDVRLDDVPVMCDNKGAIDLSKNPVLHSRTKHIEIRYHFLRDNVQK